MTRGAHLRPSAPLRAAGAGVLSAVLFAASLWLPPVGFLGCLVSPLPLALVAWRQGIAGVAVAAPAAAAVLFGLSGPVGVAVFVSQFAAGGCVLGLALRAGKRPEVVVGGYALLSVAAFWGSLIVLAGQADSGPLAYLDHTLRQAVEQAGAFLLQGQEGADAQTALAVQTWAEETGRVLALTFPGLYAVLAILTGWANALLARRLAGDRTPGGWSSWRAPEAWIWGLIGSGLLALLAGGAVGALSLNLFVAALGVYFLQGLAVVHHLFEAKGFPRLFRVAAYALLFVQLPVMLVVAGVGAFDLWFDFRARWSPQPPEQSLHT